MVLDITFRIEKTDLLYQQDTYCRISFTNTGAKPIQVPPPLAESLNVAARITEAKTGIEVVHRKSLPAGTLLLPPEFNQLQPGKRVEERSLLRELLPLPFPGEYEISVLADYDETKQAESNPVPITVHPTTARNLCLVPVNGAVASVLYAAWVNMLSEPPQIVRSTLDVMSGGQAYAATPAAPANIRARPVICSPASGKVLHSHWIAWMDGRQFNYTHLSTESGALKTRKLDVGSGAEIVEPLYSDVPSEPLVRPAGAALTVVESPEGDFFRLQKIGITEKRATLAEYLDLPGERPLWMRSLVRPTGPKLVTYVQTAANAVRLHMVPWPGETGGQAGAKKLSEWAGTFVAATTAMQDGNIYGACLLWLGQATNASLEVIPWQIDNNGQFKLDKPQPESGFGWTRGEIAKALVRLNCHGKPVVLLQDSSAKWYFHDGFELSPVGGNYAKTKLPIDVAFLGGRTVPVLIVGGQGQGLQMVMPDGSPLPPEYTP